MWDEEREDLRDTKGRYWNKVGGGRRERRVGEKEGERDRVSEAGGRIEEGRKRGEER